MLTKEDAVKGLMEVYDPEIHLDVWTLELIYNLDIKEDTIKVTMTLTSPACPFAPELIADIEEKLKLRGFKEVEVDVVFDPPWEPSDEVKMELGLL